mgnify:CR=1 FL=1
MIADPAAGFAATYREAREKFVAAATERGLALESHAHPTQRGAQGETLAIDLALAGPAEASSVLLLTSGTHGAEGFCGSGCQVNLLRDDAWMIRVARSGVRVLLLHAMNPHGFSHLARTNENNIDLNRNFRDFSAPPAPNVAYAEVHGFMVPPTWPPAPANEARLADYVREHGQWALQQAVSSGQCEFPNGLFYGGTGPAWSNDVLRDVLRRHVAGAWRLGWIDFHTGLGPWGHGEKIWNGGPRPQDLARAKSWWGHDVTSFHDGSSTSAKLSGVNHQAVYDECPAVEYTGIALEYGTRPVLEVLEALRADAWLRGHPQAPALQRAAIKAGVRHAFHDDSEVWQRRIHEQGDAAVAAALERLGTA